MAADPEYAAEVKARRAEDDREYYEANRDRKIAYQRDYYRDHRDHYLVQFRQYHVDHADDRNAAHRQWHAEHRDEQNAKRRERSRHEYRADPRKVNDYQKAWRAAHPELARAYVRLSIHRRRSQIAGEHITAKQLFALFEAHGNRCFYCGTTGRMTVDHRVPLSRGGTNSLENLVPACRSCNSMKHDRTDDEFRDYLARYGRPVKDEATGTGTTDPEEREGPSRRDPPAA
ncbi:MAG TPA: HNH endonuclease [Candidatus Limnocylindria bacterium]|nr:HNH endonuclease [Candidatus Limnocylindria bacterium]